MNSILNSIKKVGTIPCFLIFGYFLGPFNQGYLFGYALMLFFVINKEVLKSSFDTDTAILFFFCLVYSLFYSFDPEKGTQFIFIYLFFPSCFYMFGKYIAKRVPDSEHLFYFVFALGIIFSSLGLLSTTYDIMVNGFVQTVRNVGKIWGGDPINATGMAAYLFANMCIPAIVIFGFSKKKLRFNLVALAIYVVTVACVLRLGSRTQLGITIITLAISSIYMLVSFSPIKKIAFAGVLFLLVNIGFNFISLDKDSDLLASYATRMKSKEYGAATAGGRTERWEKSIVNLYEEPLGWPTNEFGYSHNMWLDAARIGGTLSFILLVLFSVKSALKAKKILRYKTLNREFRNIMLIYSIAFVLQFFVEPTLDGSHYLFVFFCLFQGILNQTIENEEKRLAGLKS